MTARRRRLIIAATAMTATGLLAPVSASAAPDLSVPAAPAAPSQAPSSSATSSGPAGVAIPEALSKKAGSGPVQVVVAYDGSQAQRPLTMAANSTDERKQEASAQARSMLRSAKSSALSRVRGATLDRDFDNLPVQVVTVADARALAELAAAPGVTSVTERRRYSMAGSAAEPDPAGTKTIKGSFGRPTLNTSWGVLVNQPKAVQNGYDGRGTRVAVLDTGITTSSAAARATFGDCSAGFGQRNCRIDSFQDTGRTGQQSLHPHGTNVAGVVADVAPATQLDIYNVFTTDGRDVWADDADILGALNDVAGKAASRRIKAVNLSLGDVTFNTTPCSGSSFSGSFRQLRAAGVVPVVASGNDAYQYSGAPFVDGISDPACAPGAVSVGAVVSSSGGSIDQGYCVDAGTPDHVACFGQTSPNLSVVAPGVEISAAGVTMTGTSQATPMVAGAVAAAASAGRTATGDRLATAVTSTGKPVVDSRTGRTVRRLDMYAAATSLAASPNQVSSVSGRLNPGQSLQENQQLVSPNGQHVLRTQVLGLGESLALSSASCDTIPVKTLAGEWDNRLSMQTDGNLVLYSNGSPQWFSKTSGNPGAYAMLQNDRNLVVYSAAGKPLWALNKTCDSASTFDTANRVLQGNRLTSGQLMMSPNRAYRLQMQGDGNLVLVGPRGPVWQSRTSGAGNFFAVQSDNNMVVYSAAGRPLWVSGTSLATGVFPAYTTSLKVQSDGNLVLVKSTGGARWATNTQGK